MTGRWLRLGRLALDTSRATCGRRFMLYNGNGFGRTGVGLAVWKAQSQGRI